jgi:exonuclease III
LNRQNIQTKNQNNVLELNNTMDKMDLTDICRVFHPTGANYTFFSAHVTFSKIDHILGCKANHNKYKKLNNPLYPNRS